MIPIKIRRYYLLCYLPAVLEWRGPGSGSSRDLSRQRYQVPYVNSPESTTIPRPRLAPIGVVHTTIRRLMSGFDHEEQTIHFGKKVFRERSAIFPRHRRPKARQSLR